MNTARLKYLFELYLNDSCSKAEQEELFRLLKQEGAMEFIRASVPAIDLNEKDFHRLSDQTSAEILEIMLKVQPGRKTNPVKQIPVFKSVRWAVAAAVVLLVATGAYFWINTFYNTSHPSGQLNSNINSIEDIQPGKERAILTLADGRQLDLDSAANGSLATQGNVRIVKKDGVLTYVFEESEEDELFPVAYNTLTTPRGGQQRLELPDGTRVWLNAASSIRFPTKFDKDKRAVEASGELYFEVVSQANHHHSENHHNSDKPSGSGKLPFIVSISGAQVEVLGTHFNINAYPEEGETKTTLLEGAVRVKSFAQEVLLKPGQQSKIADNGSISVEKNVDTDQVIAWKNKEFNFHDTDIRTIMNRLALWYDIEVKYSSTVPSKRFTSNISMNTNLSQMLDILKASGLKFSLAGRVLTVHS